MLYPFIASHNDSLRSFTPCAARDQSGEQAGTPTAAGMLPLASTCASASVFLWDSVQRGRIRWKREVSPRSDLNRSSSALNATIVLEAVLFLKVSFSAPVILRVIIAPVIFHVPRIVPAIPSERVLARNPVGCSSHTKEPSPLIDIVSFKSPTVPCQSPTILSEYSASEAGAELCVQDPTQNPKTTTAIAPTQVQLDFTKSTLSSFFLWHKL